MTEEREKLGTLEEAVHSYARNASYHVSLTHSPVRDEILHAHKAILSYGAEGMEALRDLMSHKDNGVRLCAAIHCLQAGEPEAAQVLAELAQAPGLLGISAVEALEQWREQRPQCDQKGGKICPGQGQSDQELPTGPGRQRVPRREARAEKIARAAFKKELRTHQRTTRRMRLRAGDPGCLPVTKISGSPWWPASRPRPRCGLGHSMSFMAQVRLADVPGLEERRELLSFHYCQQCAYDGRMSFGCHDDGAEGYEVTLLTADEKKATDGLATVAEVVIPPRRVALRNVREVPGYEQTSIMLPDLPDDYPGGKDDFDERIYPGCRHVARSKLGGWPSWVQPPEPPTIREGEVLHFVAQLDCELCEDTTWAGGGYAYLFLVVDESDKPRGELVVQTG